MATASVISALPAIVFVSHVQPVDEIAKTRAYYIVVGVLSLLGVAVVYVILVVTYATIKKNIRKRIQRRRSTLTKSDPQLLGIQLEKRKDVRVLKIFVIMCSMYALTFLPHIIYTLYFSHNMNSTSFGDYITMRVLELLYTSSALINPLLTLLYKADYRKRLLKAFKRKEEDIMAGSMTEMSIISTEN